MNGRVCLLAGLTVLAIIGLPVSSAPQGDDIQICLADTSEVLKGVKSISVLVDAIAKDAQEDGLNRGAIRTDVELRLRQSGIQVPTAAEELTNPSLPELYVNVHALKEKDKPIYIYNVLVEFKENACLERNRQMVVFGATTWSQEILGSVGANNLPQVRDDVKDLVDKFLNDYLKANPKK